MMLRQPTTQLRAGGIDVAQDIYLEFLKFEGGFYANTLNRAIFAYCLVAVMRPNINRASAAMCAGVIPKKGFFLLCNSHQIIRMQRKTPIKALVNQRPFFFVLSLNNLTESEIFTGGGAS
ncbi:MAG: hypothetical protein LBU53_07405 [Zoogloeaceae bacterium]|nr:hypothetical protein [Zoogloeaceae bacterium]